MKKELTKEELIEYVKKHGETKVILTENYGDYSFRQKGDIVYVNFEKNKVWCSRLDHGLVDSKYNYSGYKGKFILVETGFLADEYEWLEEGDLVDVHEESYHFGGEKGLEIKKVDRKHHIYEVFNKEEGETRGVCPFHTRPHTPEEAEEMTLEEVCKELGREIKIKK